MYTQFTDIEESDEIVDVFMYLQYTRCNFPVTQSLNGATQKRIGFGYKFCITADDYFVHPGTDNVDSSHVNICDVCYWYPVA